MVQKLEAQGGRGGEAWDDGGAYENVKKVYVGQGDSGVVYVKFDYEKDGKIVSQEHGKKGLLGTEEFELESGDYITSVTVYYEKVFGVPVDIITALIFKTVKGKTSQPFGMVSGEKAELGGGKIVGFHGTANDCVHSLGAYVAPSTTPVVPSGGPTKLEAKGGRGGEEWDDGGAYENVKKVYVGQGDSGVVYVKFDYEKDGKIVSQEHGKKGLLGTEEFELESGDYITSVTVYYEKVFGVPVEIITALIFKTFKGKTSQPFGMVSGEEAELGGGKIVGFHGSASDCVHSIGVYIAPSSTPLTPSGITTLPGHGGDAGVAWNDGAHDNVKKIYVGQGDSCVTYFKAEYEKASKPVLGSDHGKKSLLGAEEFVLEEGEYITAVSGFYDKIFGVDAPAIISVKFKTNKRTSIPYGIEAGTQFVLEKQGHKIVGFHGQAGDYLYKLGVNVAPITN